MTDRAAAKLKRTDQVRPAKKSGPEIGAADEIARLERELAAAMQRIALLEQSNIDATNRIEWVIESLHNLPHGK